LSGSLAERAKKIVAGKPTGREQWRLKEQEFAQKERRHRFEKALSIHDGKKSAKKKSEFV